MEEGLLVLIGGNNRKPLFYNQQSPLCPVPGVVQLEPLSTESIMRILRRALADEVRGLGKYRIRLDEMSWYTWRKLPMVMPG